MSAGAVATTGTGTSLAGLAAQATRAASAAVHNSNFIGLAGLSGGEQPKSYGRAVPLAHQVAPLAARSARLGGSGFRAEIEKADDRVRRLEPERRGESCVVRCAAGLPHRVVT